MKKDTNLVPAEIIENKIYLIRGAKVMLDFDLAKLYGVPPKAFNQAVKRNIERFPDDFMFQLLKEEALSLRSQFVTIKKGRGQHSKYQSFAFTEQGVAMLSSVLKSKRAILVNVAIIRAFVKLRELISTHKDLAHKIEDLERKYGKHDREIQIIFQAIKRLIDPPLPKTPKEPIGFRDRSKD